MFASVLTHLADKWTIPAQNETTISQVNGGDEELIAMHSTNSILVNTRLYIWPIVGTLVFFIIMIEMTRLIDLHFNKKEEKEKHEKN